MAAKGWLTAHWPKAYGGLGWGVMDQVVLRETLTLHEAPILNGPALNQLAAVLLRFGTEEQKQRFLPGIATGEVMWCQGFSEPNAGTDLASLQTRAVRDGDDWVLNGTKIWTGHGAGADWMYMLARTDTDAPKHKGISFLLLDMQSPGLEVVRLQGMNGYTMGCQEYFEDVRVPGEQLIGEENRGWYVGMALLDFERSGIARATEAFQGAQRLVGFYRDHRAAVTPSFAGREGIRHQLAERVIEAEVARYFSYRIASEQEAGRIPNYEASMGKAYQSELEQRIAYTGLTLTGLYAQAEAGARWDDGRRSLYGQTVQTTTIGTIAGGNNEIQRDIIARRGFGLPRS